MKGCFCGTAVEVFSARPSLDARWEGEGALLVIRAVAWTLRYANGDGAARRPLEGAGCLAGGGQVGGLLALTRSRDRLEACPTFCRTALKVFSAKPSLGAGWEGEGAYLVILAVAWTLRYANGDGAARRPLPGAGCLAGERAGGGTARADALAGQAGSLSYLLAVRAALATAKIPPPQAPFQFSDTL